MRMVRLSHHRLGARRSLGNSMLKQYVLPTAPEKKRNVRSKGIECIPRGGYHKGK